MLTVVRTDLLSLTVFVINFAMSAYLLMAPGCNMCIIMHHYDALVNPPFALKGSRIQDHAYVPVCPAINACQAFAGLTAS